MSKQYNWRLASQIISGGYAGEDTGVIPPDTGWRTTDVMSGSSSAEYYFRDSDYSSNANSSRVVVGITESWTASIDSRNNLTITLTTQITGVRRDDVQGSPGVGQRNMFIRREAGGTVLWSVRNDPIATVHTILSNPITLDSYTFTLAPGQNLSRGSVHFRNVVTGYPDDTPVPSPYVDEMWIGTEFRNPLPADYRPGKVWNGSAWMSHNRDAGAANVRTSSAWQEMRTIGGGEDQGNPPTIRHSSAWYNMRLTGQE